MIDAERVKHESLDVMFAFLQMGGMKSNYPALKENCLKLRQMLIQKTGGQAKYAKKGHIPFEDLDTICNFIVLEAMALVLSGDLEEFYKNDE